MIPKYIIYSFRNIESDGGNYFCILDRNCTRHGYYYQDIFLRKRLSKKLVNLLLPSFYQFRYHTNCQVSIKHEEIFKSDNRRELLQTFEGRNIEVYYEIP